MADNTPVVAQPFELKARTVTSGPPNAPKVELEIDVKNMSATGDWVTPLLIEFKLPADLTTQAVQDAALAASTSEEPRNMASLGGVVTAAAGWSVWAITQPYDYVIGIRVFNNIDQQTGAPAASTARLAAGATLTLRIPLAPAAQTAQFMLDYGYQTGLDTESRFDGSLELTPTKHGDWKPQVVLQCDDHTSPTMLPPGEEVKISWSVKNGVAATLRGPLPGGNSELTLSRDQSSNYKIEAGWLKTLAVGPATYILDAEVVGPDGVTNVQVVRTLTLDIFSGGKYGNLSLRPNRVLPNGQVEIDWAVWGVDAANIDVGGRLSLDLELTQQNLSRTFQGTGVWRVHAKDNLLSEPVSLTIQVNKKSVPLDDAFIKVTQWEKVKGELAFTGKPLAMAVAEGNMALLTSDGLYTANVGKSDTDTKDPNFVKSPATGKAWYALTAYGREFVVLRRTDGGDVVVERYDASGNRVGLPVTLPGDFQTLSGRVGSTLDLAVYGNRAYVVADSPAYGRTARSAYSLRLDAEERARPEGLLATLINYRLISSCGALYAFRRSTGRMLRFGLTRSGDLEEPTNAAGAVNDRGESMIKTGLLVPTGSVFAVLDPAALPALDMLRVFGLQNVTEFVLKNMPSARRVNEIPKDLAYNPQQDRWTACGQGLQIQGGAVAAYRGGGSKRVWVLQPDGTMYKLSGAKEELFAADYVEKFPHKVLPPVFDATREFTLVNLSSIELVPMDDVCIAAGLPGFSAEGVAALTTPIPRSMPHASRQPFKVSYKSGDQSPVTLRMMAAGCQGSRYYFEVTLSGPGLNNAILGFKRLSPEGQVANVPGTTTRQAASVDIRAQPAQYLSQETALYVVNVTPRDMVLDPRLGTDKINPYVGVEINYRTAPFKILIPGMENAGHLTVDLDFTKTMGCAASPSSEPQSSVIRINTDNINKLDAEVNQHSKFHFSIAEFKKYDGSKFRIPPQRHDTPYSLQVRLKLMSTKSSNVLDGVRVGDGALSRDGKYVWVALARPYNINKVRILRMNTDTLSTAEQVVETPGGIFSLPNAIALSDRHYYAMLGEISYYQGSPELELPAKRKVDGYNEFMALAASPGGSLYFIGRWEKWEGAERLPVYTLVNENNSVVIQLDRLRSAAAGVPMAVSPDGKTVAICISGGMLVVDVPNKKVHEAMPALPEPAAVAFTNDGQWVYFAHMTRVMSVNPRRADSGRNITISRVNINRPTVVGGKGLDNVNGNFSVTANTKQSFRPNEYPKEQVALTLAVSPDDKFLFVSAGTSIMRFAIGPDSFNLQPWRENVEMPCRLVGVKMAGGGSYTVIALGSYYRGDGTTVDEYKTQLYFVPAPAN
ncbi:MAG: hypothetical protein ABW208_10005 [Pyrinomonadaceae bacterium]